MRIVIDKEKGIAINFDKNDSPSSDFLLRLDELTQIIKSFLELTAGVKCNLIVGEKAKELEPGNFLAVQGITDSQLACLKACGIPGDIQYTELGSLDRRLGQLNEIMRRLEVKQAPSLQVQEIKSSALLDTQSSATPIKKSLTAMFPIDLPVVSPLPSAASCSILEEKKNNPQDINNFNLPDQKVLDNALLKAIKKSKTSDVKDLLDAGASPNACDIFGTTVLDLAVDVNNLEIIIMLLDKGVNDANTKNTTFERAIKIGNYEVIQVLLKKGRKVVWPMPKDLEYAIELGDPKVIEVLLENGVDSVRSSNSALEMATQGVLKNESDPGRLEIFKIFFLRENPTLYVNHTPDWQAIISAIKNGVSQTVILDRLRAYLVKVGRDQIFIEKLGVDEGHCAGISILWLYAKWLQTQPKKSDKPRDDYDWFRRTVYLIAGWDKNRLLMQEEAAEFERFTSLIEFFQNVNSYFPSGNQKNLTKRLEATDHKERPLKKEYSIASLLTLKQLKQLLCTSNIIQDGKLIYIVSHDHATALFKTGLNYVYFDPNSNIGEVKTDSLDKVAELIFAANGFIDYYPSPLGFSIFSFDKTVGRYTPPQEILDKIGPVLNPVKGYADDYSGLMVAANVDSLESVRYLLNRGADFNLVNKNGMGSSVVGFAGDGLYAADIAIEILNHVNKVKPGSADQRIQCLLMSAVNDGRVEDVRLFLDNGVSFNGISEKYLNQFIFAVFIGDVKAVTDFLRVNNLTSKTIRIAFRMAVKRGHASIVKILLENGASPNEVDDDGRPLLILAVSKNDLATVKNLLEKKADPDIADKFGWTPLTLAAKRGYVGIIEELANHGASLDLFGQGDSALMHAVEAKKAVAVKKLLAEGANPNLVSKSGFVLTNAMFLSNDEEYKKILKIFITDPRTDPNIDSVYGTVIDLAIDGEYVDVIAEFMDRIDPKKFGEYILRAQEKAAPEIIKMFEDKAARYSEERSSAEATEKSGTSSMSAQYGDFGFLKSTGKDDKSAISAVASDDKLKENSGGGAPDLSL